MTRSRYFIAALALLALFTAVSAAEKRPPFERRAVELPGSLDRADLEDHLGFLQRLGFNTIWVRANQISPAPLAASPEIEASFTRLADSCRRHRMRLIVALNPVAAGAQMYAISDRELVRAIRRFARKLVHSAGAYDLVLSFSGSGAELAELRDILAYGRFAGAAHADLMKRVRSRLPRKIGLWIEPESPYSDAGDISQRALAALKSLPSAVGVVWHGTAPPARQVALGDLDRLTERIGVRPVLLRDAFPANQYGNRMPLAHNLGPLRGRDAALARRLFGHASLAMEDWGASRLTLMTTADWLRDPDHYIAEESWERAIASLAGDDGEAREALRTQALEWGGMLGGRNHHTAEQDNPTSSARILRDPALVARWRWTLTRYPQRMAQLRGLADPFFRDELLETMARRLAIARAIPAVRETLARKSAGRSDLAGLIEELQRHWNRTTPASARTALQRFLIAADVWTLVQGAEDDRTERD